VTEPFFTKKAMGHGLGLFIVNKIIRQHNGQLYIDSQVGEGTQILVWLPPMNES